MCMKYDLGSIEKTFLVPRDHLHQLSPVSEIITMLDNYRNPNSMDCFFSRSNLRMFKD